ncbi:MAG: hypothetical protein JWR19_4143 [Pedosphaera sp.]|nr:hypothetical protein [Pedosphaera sp.]
MRSEELVKLIEEMVDLKVRHHAAVAACASRAAPHLAKIISQTNVADQHRLVQIRSELARVLEG